MSEISTEGGGGGKRTALMRILESDDIEPGSDPSYQVCKDLYTNHPLGGKMVDAPIRMAMSESRVVTVDGAPEECLKAFEKEWAAVEADVHIANGKRISRIYGQGSMVIGCKQVPSDKPLDMTKIWQQDIWFSELDPLNTAGSLTLNQSPRAPDFLKPLVVTTNGETYHRSRSRVLFNESPIFLSWTPSAFGFVGRSVYQRALFPLKTYIRSMVADDAIMSKLGVFIAKKEQAGSIQDNMMMKASAIRRWIVKLLRSGDVLEIGPNEDVTTLNMMNVDGAGKYARGNVLKNIATAADMPAILLENETMAEGFADGTEDAKTVVRYINMMRRELQPLFSWFDNIVRYRAWNPEFYRGIQAKYPELYGAMPYEMAFSNWRAGFKAEWPSLLLEPESERVKVSQVKFEAVIATLQTLLPQVDPTNQAALIQWAADLFSDEVLLFTRPLTLDIEGIQLFLEERKDQQDEAAQMGGAGEEEGEASGVARKFGKFDSASRDSVLANMRSAIARLPQRRARH